MWNNLSRALFLLVLLLGAALAWLYWGQTAQLLSERAELEERNRSLALESSNLKQHIAYLGFKLEEDVARVAREKDEELARLRTTHDDLAKTLQKEVELGQVRVTQMADRLTVSIVDKILFPSGEDRLSEPGRQVLKRVGQVLAQARDKVIRIEGHTDNVPPGAPLKPRFPTNWELSAARATNVVRFLQESAGLDPAALEAVGLGEHHPRDDNKTAAGRAQNRRIEIILYPRIAAGPKADKPAESKP
jgi:chemotaxis protein MotB